MWENFLLLCFTLWNYSRRPVEEEERPRKQVIDSIFMGRLIQAIQALIGWVLTALFFLRGGGHAAFIVPMVCRGKTRERRGDKGLNGNSSPCVPLPPTAAGRLVSPILDSSAAPTLSVPSPGSCSFLPLLRRPLKWLQRCRRFIP